MGMAAQQVQQVQEAHDPAHGLVHWLGDVFGYWPLAGLLALGLGTVVWWRSHKIIEAWVARIAKRAIEKQKELRK